MRNILLPAAILAVLAGPALAQSAPTFADVDADSDGRVSLTEAIDADEAWSEESFEDADKDDDGSLDQDEYDAGIAARAG